MTKQQALDRAEAALRDADRAAAWFKHAEEEAARRRAEAWLQYADRLGDED